jgi:hypothetical protein
MEFCLPKGSLAIGHFIELYRNSKLGIQEGLNHYSIFQLHKADATLDAKASEDY